MNNKVYSKEFEIHYYEINKYKEATPVAILNYLEETAGCHSESVGCGIDELKQLGVAWVLSRWNLVMDRYPLWNDKITIETWSSGVERFYATREFLLKDAKGDILGRASSLWVYLNMEKKRPLRVPAEIVELYGTNPLKVMEDSFADFIVPESFEYIREFIVRKSDIDTNLHVNNARYLEWLLESIPDEAYEQYRLHSLEIIYKKETGYGISINSKRTTFESTASDKIYGHSITSSIDGAEHALAKTSWKIR